MKIITQQNLTSNNFFSPSARSIKSTTSIVNSSFLTHDRKITSPNLEKRDWKEIKSQQHAFIKSLIKKHKYKPGPAATLHELLNHCSLNGDSRVSLKTLALKCQVSTKTTERHLKIFVKDEIILPPQKNGWQQTNTNIILSIQHLNCNKVDKMSTDLNNYSLTSNKVDLNTNYSEYSSILTNSINKKEEIAKDEKKSKIKSQNKKVSESSLASPNREEEIKRVCLLWMLSDNDTQYIIKKMNDKSIISQARYLAHMVRTIAEGGRWNKDEKFMNAKKDKPQFTYAIANQDRQEKAAKQASSFLSAKGIHPHHYDQNLTPDENYKRSRSYSEQEAALIVQFMRQPSGPRPLALDTTKETDKKWSGYND